jgi:putative ABC transport system permease protein
VEIVGIVGDVRHESLGRDPMPEMYFPHQQIPLRFMALVVRSNADPLDLVGSLRNRVHALDADLPVYQVRTAEQLIAGSVAKPRFNMLLTTVLGLVALVLAVVGIYGLMTYTVSQRTHEMGLRMALGARARDVVKLVVGQGLTLTLIGLSVGLVAAFALTRVLASLLYGVSTTDPVTFIGVSVLLALVATLAAYLPARRATRVDPLTALRYE